MNQNFEFSGNFPRPKKKNELKCVIIQSQIILKIKEIAGKNFNETWFQEYCATPHWVLAVSNRLNEVFGNRWIGRDSLTVWPARSPDLTPLDFFFFFLMRTP